MPKKEKKTTENRNAPDPDDFDKKRSNAGTAMPHKSKKERLGPNTNR